MSYEEHAAQREDIHRQNWKDEPLNWWERIILDLPETITDTANFTQQIEATK